MLSGTNSFLAYNIKLDQLCHSVMNGGTVSQDDLKLICSSEIHLSCAYKAIERSDCKQLKEYIDGYLQQKTNTGW